MKMKIIKKQSRWLVNGKRLENLNAQEQGFMNDFFRETKLEEEVSFYIQRKASEQNASIRNYMQNIKQSIIT